jgi:hypothetical protein
MSTNRLIDFYNVLEEIKPNGSKNESIDYIIENDINNLHNYITFINGYVGDYGNERRLGFGPKAIETFKERIVPSNEPSQMEMYNIILVLEKLADSKQDEAIKTI